LITIYKNASSPGTIALDPRTTLTNIYGPIHTISGDLDGDGKLDLVSGNGADMVGVTIFRNTSTGSAITFDNQILLNGFVLGGFRPAIGDFNGDGKPDLAIASEETYAVHVLRNTSTPGSISFAPLLTFPAGEFPQGYFDYRHGYGRETGYCFLVRSQILLMVMTDDYMF
jgi:hypothetical protein